MNKTLTYTNANSGGKIKFTKQKYDIFVQVSLDNYGFEVNIDKEELFNILSQQNEKVRGNVSNEVTRPHDFSKEKILDTLKSMSNKRDGSSADTLRGLEEEKA